MGTRLQLRVAFGAIAALFVAVGVASLWRASAVRTQTRLLVGDMLESVELVARLSRDVGRQRRLIDSHIFVRDPAEMRRLEKDLAEARADYAQAAARYSAMPQPPWEEALWQRLQAEVDAMDPSVERALALSRVNRNEEAQGVMATLLPRYFAIDDLVSALIRTNADDAERTLRQVEHLQRTTLWTLGLVALAGILVSVMLGVAVTRRVEQQALLLEAQNRELDAFAGRVAHDLRSPLTTLQLAAGMPPERAHAMRARGIERMKTIIDDLLALSRAEAMSGACDPAETAAQLRDEISPRLEQVGARLTVEVEPAQVQCAAGLLRQVLWNLVDNAVKYRRDDVTPEVAIEGHVRNGRYDLVVRDNGVGMSADEARRAFEPFYRGRVGAIPGTGLGLALVKRVLEAAGGEVAIESQPGHGTTFLIQVPRAP
jgi:signal transduction histidine kinase